MNYDLDDYLNIKESNAEKKELLQLSSLAEDLFIHIINLKKGEISNFYEELITKMRLIIHNYVKDEFNTICSPIQKYLFLLFKLYENLIGVSFMNDKFLMNFLYNRILLFYDSLHSEDYNNIIIINDSMLNLCIGDITPIIIHCLNLIVNKYIFGGNLSDLEYLLKYFQENCTFVQIARIKKQISEIFFVQLICLNIYKNTDKLANFTDDKNAKDFIEKTITNLYNLNKNSQQEESYNNNNIITTDQTNNQEEENPMIFLFKNDYNTSNLHLLRYLRNAIINVFTPIDSNILEYFQVYMNDYSNQKININFEKDLKLNIIEEYFLNSTIQDVDIKIRNISFLIDIIMQKYFDIQYIPELDLLKFPRVNIIINRLFFEKTSFNITDRNELINAIFEHFIISQFMHNYIKYMVKDPEHYPLEIRYFIIYSYLKISEYYLTKNTISAYITCITLREIINNLKLENGFKKQKYIKKTNNANNTNNTNVSSTFDNNNKKSTKKTKRRKSVSRSKKKKKKNKKKSVQKSDVNENKIEIDIDILENYLKLENDSNVESKNSEEKIIFGTDDILDEPHKIVSKTLFNYLCLIYSMKTKYKNESKYFEELYSFIDEYITDNINSIKLDDEEWTWLLIYPTKYIKNFSLRNTFEKFNFTEQNDLDSNIKLISNLSKKIKYCNTQEQFLILDVIYNILVNIDDLNTIIKSQQYSKKMKNLNRALSYLSFNINYSVNLNKNMSFIDQELVADKLFKITNLLFIESLDEYFWIPKSVKGYKSFSEFITIMGNLYNKILYKQSLYTELFIYGILKIKKYINGFTPSKNVTKKSKEREQYILVLDYFCKLKIPKMNNIHDLKNTSQIKENIYNLMKLMPDEYGLEVDMNEKVDLLYSILLSGQFDLRVILFLICQIINKRILEENSEEINLITNVFDFMINIEYKFMINFILTIYKSLEKYLYDLIDEYVSYHFPENYSCQRKEYLKFVDFFKTSKIINYSEEGKEIQKIFYNWNLIKKQLEKTGVFYKFLFNAEEINYPKSVMNLLEKYIFDIMREKNLHRFTNVKYSESENITLLDYLKLYYKAYSHIDDNNIILDNYFNNKQLLSLITENTKNNEPNYIINKDSHNSITLDAFINNINKYLIDLDKRILFENIYIIGEIEKPSNTNNNDNTNNIYCIISRFLYNIIILNNTKIDLNMKKIYFSQLKNMEKNTILNILCFNNKLYEENNSINYSLLLYEISLYLEQFETLFTTTNDTFEFNNLLINNLKNIFINKRKIPHLKRYLLVFQFRRFLFNLYNDQIAELHCLTDILKVYKTLWETGISNEELSDFRKYIDISINILNGFDENLLLNLDQKIVLVPLKYHVKYFPLEFLDQFDSVMSKYQNLHQKKKFFSYKILILSDKKKEKTGVCGLNDILMETIKQISTKKQNNYREGFVLYTDYYLDRLISNEIKFNNIKSSPNITKLPIIQIYPEVFEYLDAAINICSLTEKEKFLRKYMPEIINLFFKLNFAHVNYLKENNENMTNSQFQTQSIAEENINRFKYLLNKFKNEINISKVKIIIPQLIICYQYENTYLNKFAIELLTLYAEENIDLIAYLLSSFLSFKMDTLKNLGIKPPRGGNDHYNNKYKNYINTFSKSKEFVSEIKRKLSQENQKILKGYEDFSEKLSNLFIENKRASNLSNTSKRDIRAKQAPFIKDINRILVNNKIILPTIENINKYKSEIRNNNNINNTGNDVLFLKELDTKIETLSSKEKPLHIRFKVTNITGDLNTNNYYDFMLKCDVNDITKEIKTFEIIDEINNIFKIKHFDINDSMSLKRYLIVPIAPTIILAEWLSNSVSLASVIDEQGKKNLIFQEENNGIVKYGDKVTIIPGSIIRLEEKFNILYNYYQYYFFDPNLWYLAKKKYIISTAIWSMTSFLVGLGDRHPGNIMINKTNGEVIHIDFGYVALKGLSLAVPEIVDFRFTINLRKNLGLFEENGIFNYICVKTLKTFKEYYKTLSARIEYYQFDPLFDSENDNNTFTLFNQNDKFFKVLDDNNVKEKLQNLVAKNSNVENLEKMYTWWSPWI